jgi:hypothetical protein
MILVFWLGLILAAGTFIHKPFPTWLFALFALLPFLSLAVMGIVPISQNFMRSLKDEQLHHLHLWRVPFAFVLLWFYQSNVLPLELTFEGINYDIIIGLTAPVVGSLAFSQKMLNKEIVLGWNAIGIVLLIISTTLLLFDLEENVKSKAAFSQFPYLFAFGFLYPASFYAHALVIYRIIKGDVKVSD